MSELIAQDDDHLKLKDVYKVEERCAPLYQYLRAMNMNVSDRGFHQLDKHDLIERYKQLTEKHLKLLEEL